MKKLIKTLRNILAVIGDIYALSTAYKEYKDDIASFFTQIKNWNLIAIGQGLAFIGTLVTIAILLIFIIVKIINPKKPQQSVVDMIAPILLPSDELGISDYNRERFEVWLIIFSVSLMVFGVVLVFGVKLYQFIF